MAFNIDISDRVSIVGKTGSGKTVFTKKLLKGIKNKAISLSFRYPIIVLDLKGVEKSFKNFGHRVKYLDQVIPSIKRFPVTVYSPIAEENNDIYIDEFFNILYDYSKPLLLYIDELSLVGQKDQMPLSYFKFMKQGRERNQAVWAGTQNPVFVNHDFFSNADHFYIFDLILKKDREKMAGFAGDEVIKRPHDRHGFWYYNTNERSPEYFINKLGPMDLETTIEDKPDVAAIEFNKIENVKEEKSMTKRWVVSIFLLGLVLLFVMPLWKKVFQFIAEKAPATQPIANYTSQA